uniref:CASPASE_P20 domain-containing protein n=1 Tax=Heterorhabditis bacteriophora TaxID=37862 RepID=A0A1I7XQ22_HETBA
MMEFNVSQDSKSRMVCTLDSSKEQKNSDDTMMKLFGIPNKTLQLSEDITKHEDILEESCIEMNSIAHNDTCDGASTDFICKSAAISTDPSNVCTKLDGRPVQNATILLSSDDVDMSDIEEKNGATINLSTEDINMSVTPPFELKICNLSPQFLLKKENSASLHSLLEETTSFIRMTMFEEQSLQMDGRITSMKDNSIRQLDPLLLSLTLSDSIRAHAVKTLCVRNLNAEDSDLLLAGKYQAETEWFAIRRDIAVDARIEVDDAVSKDETEVNILHDQMVMCQNLVQLKKVVSDLEQECLSISMIDTTKISDIITEHDKEMATSEQLEATILQLELKNLLILTNEMEIDSVILFLKTHGVFTNAIVDKLMTTGSPLHIRAALVRNLKTRGDVAFDKFFLALLRSGQNNLAMLLRPLVDESVLQSIENESAAQITEQNIATKNFMIHNKEMEHIGLLKDLHVEMIDGDTSAYIEQYEKNKHLVSHYSLILISYLFIYCICLFQIYPNFSAPKGLCLIINNEKFSTMTRRQGTEVDQINLSNLFNQLGYTVIVENDLTCKEMLFRIRSFAADPSHRNASSAIVVVLTHGERDNLFGVGGDDILSINNFLGELNARNAPLLAEKPKLVFIQACRGEQRDPGFSSHDYFDCSHEDGPFDFLSCVRPSSGNETISQRLPLEADFLISYATPPRFVSWRNSLKGSWFIQAICQDLISTVRQKPFRELRHGTTFPSTHPILYYRIRHHRDNKDAWHSERYLKYSVLVWGVH